MSPALVGGFFSTEPSGKPQHNLPDRAVGGLCSHQSTGFNDLLLSRCTDQILQLIRAQLRGGNMIRFEHFYFFEVLSTDLCGNVQQVFGNVGLLTAAASLVGSERLCRGVGI